MNHSAGDHPGIHRSPMVAPARTKAEGCAEEGPDVDTVALHALRERARSNPSAMVASNVFIQDETSVTPTAYSRSP
jgi:hypothetical protein